MRYEEPAYKKYLAKPNRVSGKKRVKLLKNLPKDYDPEREEEKKQEYLRSKLPPAPKRRLVKINGERTTELF